MLDPKALDFWANVFKTAAEQQRLADQSAKLIEQSAQAFGRMMASAFPAPQAAKQETPDPRPAADAFTEALAAHGRLFGLVPIAEHQAVVRERDRLKDRVAELEREAETLRAYLDQTRTRDAVGESIARLIQVQGDQFTSLMEKMGFSPPAAGPADEKETS